MLSYQYKNSWVFIAKQHNVTIFNLELVEERKGFVCFQVSGKKVNKIFANEGGGHRFQRVSPTDKRGRVHTSTITIAILPELQQHEYCLDDKDLQYTTRRGSGAGGQHRNVTDSCVDLIHIPTGIKVTIDGRCQHKNKALARKILCAKLLDNERQQSILLRNRDRKQQVGCGMRGDKRRTIRVNDNQVVDHILGKSTTWKDYAKGNFDGLIK